MPWPSYHFIASQLHPLTWACLQICTLGTRYTSCLVVLEIPGRGQLSLPFLGDYSPLSMSTVEQSVESLSVVMSAHCGHITHNWQAPTARYENAKKITAIGTCTLIQNPSGRHAFSSTFTFLFHQLPQSLCNNAYTTALIQVTTSRGQ